MLLLLSVTKAQQANVQIVMNYSPGSCKVQFEYWIKNPTNGNGSIQVAVSNAAFQWDSTMFTLVKDSSLTTGLNLPDIYPGKPDVDSFSSRTVNGSLFRTLDMKRSTKYCDNIYIINPGQSKPLGLIVLQFKNCSDANAYNFIDTSAANYIADINDGITNPSSSRKILAIVNKTTRPMDKSGTNCNAGQTISNLNNVPVGDTTSAQFVAQSPLSVRKIIVLNAFKQNNRVQLDWQAENNINIKNFEVQRRKDNKFETIDYVSPLTYTVNDKEFLNYSFSDPILTNEATLYYRIKQVNMDGKEIYSEIKAIRTLKRFEVLIYPNPSNGKVNIVMPEGPGNNEIRITDFSGKLIKTVSGYNIYNMQLPGLQRGIYSVTITNKESGERVSQKITVQ